ncbi:hypothetical protein M8C21_000088 [Ambrosia artemisiifolia]|uniref:Aquaporin NIP-type n=1 Tax=Ambrosia artemisiifolia TaxID=4212 RepID=A0AAD5BL55_AMBAR|nr:hypothetical protein M8C21_000088 [Ambrosia artemisiifolia]
MSSKDHGSDLEESRSTKGQSPRRRHEDADFCSSTAVVVLTQKVFAETVGTYFLIFVGCGAFLVDKKYGSITFPGMAAAWGLVIVVMAYAVGHISGGHFNPAVTIAFAVPSYIAAQMLGSILASGTLCLLYDVDQELFFGTLPSVSYGRALVLEIIITFLLMFVISGVATDNRSSGDFAGLAIGLTILINVLTTGQVCGASMNPARSLGPAIVMHNYKAIWIYIVGPVMGAILGAFAYNLIRYTDKPLNEITKSSSLLRSFTGN